MDITPFQDLAKSSNDLMGSFRVPNIILAPANLMFNAYGFELGEWQSIKYGDEEIDLVPDDKRGIYAFVICHQHKNLPPHGYIMYIGIAGRDSNRSLRARYRDYLRVGLIAKRQAISYMIGNWSQVLRFFFVPVENDISNDQLKEMEIHLNTALLPPLSAGDLEADTRKRRKAFT